MALFLAVLQGEHSASSTSAPLHTSAHLCTPLHASHVCTSAPEHLGTSAPVAPGAPAPRHSGTPAGTTVEEEELQQQAELESISKAVLDKTGFEASISKTTARRLYCTWPQPLFRRRLLLRTSHYAPRTTHYAPRTTHYALRTTHHSLLTGGK